MGVLVRHLTGLALLLFTSLPLTIETGLATAQMQLKLGSLPFTQGLALTWLGTDHFRVQSQSQPAPYSASLISPVIEFRFAEKNGLARLQGSAALTPFVRSAALVILLAMALLAVTVLTGSVAAGHPTQALPVIGLALSLLEFVHLAVLRYVRQTIARLSAVLGAEGS